MQIGIHSSDCQMKIIFVKVCSHRYSTFRLQYDNAGKCNSMPSYLIYIYIYIFMYIIVVMIHEDINIRFT